MSDRHVARRWASSVVVQALGPLCAFATVFVVARLGGAAAQGRFAQTKAWVDLLVVLGCFGFPQSIVYVVNRLAASARRLAWISLAYGLAFAPLAWLVTAWGQSRGWAGSGLEAGMAGTLVPALAGVLLVLHGLLRGVYLTQRQGVSFALLSILPAATLLAVMIATHGQGPYGDRILMAAVLSALVALLLTAAQLRHVAPTAAATPWRALFSNGTQVFVQAVLMAVQPLLAYGLVRALGGGDAQVGYLNSGVFITQGLIVPIGLVSPLMFARWTSNHDAGLLKRLQRNTSRWIGWGVLAGAALALASICIVPLVFGAGYRVTAFAVALIVLAVPQAAHGRLLAPALHAHGVPGVNTVGAALRLIGLVLVSWLAAQTGLGEVAAVALGWSCGEWLSLAWTLVALRRLSADDPAPVALAAGGPR